MNIAQHLATTLKTLRQQRGWSLSRLAEETGCQSDARAG